MVWNNIINEIRRMESKYQEKTKGRRGKFICLDANAEARLAAYLVSRLTNPLPSLTDDREIDILENGVRHLKLPICGMELRFDCPSFCISD
jgi:hypothetical protein